MVINRPWTKPLLHLSHPVYFKRVQWQQMCFIRRKAASLTPIAASRESQVQIQGQQKSEDTRHSRHSSRQINVRIIQDR